MNGTVEDFLAQLRGLLAAGVHEQPKGSNDASPVTDPPFFHGAWCAMTVSYCAARSGFPWLKTAQVLQIRRWAEEGHNGMQWLSVDQARPGDMLIWRNDEKDRNHVNVVEKVDGGRRIHLGGNESDGMRRATWSDGLGGYHLKGVARLPFEKATTPIVMGGLPVHEFGSRILKVVDPALVGTDVAWWQTLMAAPVTGTYDEATAAKTKEFQRKARVTDDGKVGPDTVGAMRRTLAFLAAMDKPRG